MTAVFAKLSFIFFFAIYCLIKFKFIGKNYQKLYRKLIGANERLQRSFTYVLAMQLSVLTSYFRILTTFKWNNSTSFPLALRTSSIWRWNAQHKIGNPDSSNKSISRAGPFPVLLGLESTENRPRTSIDIHKKWIMIIIIPLNYLFFVWFLREKIWLTFNALNS